MPERDNSESLEKERPELTMKLFLEETPPDTFVDVNDLEPKSGYAGYMRVPELLLYCSSDVCGGFRGFDTDKALSASDSWNYEFIQYICRNCRKRNTRYAVGYIVQSRPTNTANGRGTFMKLGQMPSFGPHTPARVISLIGPDREMFLQGRRAENRGMGIGAFAYYRRVVENQKNRIIGEIAKVAKVLGSTPEVDRTFERAMQETQFTKSIEMVKDVIPQALMISGHNPLLLLHSALSQGLHNEDMSDARCLEKAQSIRIILVELTERASQALKDDKEIQLALSALLSRK